MPATTPSTKMGALPCQRASRILECLAASFSRNRRFRDLLGLSTFRGCASGRLDDGYAESARSTLAADLSQTDAPLTLLATCLLFCFRVYRMGGVAGRAHPLAPPRPAMHRDGYTALHVAASRGNRRIVRKLIGANAVVDAQDNEGRAFPVRLRRVRPSESPPPACLCRDTPLHWAANNGQFEAIEELLLSGAAGAIQNSAGYRCAAPHSRPNRTAARVQADAEATRGTVREARGVRGGGDAGARIGLHATFAPPPTASCPSLPDGMCRRIGLRRSPSAYADSGGSQPPTQHSHG